MRDLPAVETRDLDEDKLLDVDAPGGIVAVTASSALYPDISYEKMPA